MKKKVINVLAIGAVAALLFLNVNVVLNNESTSYLKLGAFSLAQADGSGSGSGSGGGSTGYATRSVTQGEIDETATINNQTYERTCKYTQVVCAGTGTINCTSSLTLSNCTAFVLVN